MIEQIRAKILAGKFEFTRHATDQSILRQITVQEIRDAVENGEIVEDYPEDARAIVVLCWVAEKTTARFTLSVPIRKIIWLSLRPTSPAKRNGPMIS